ncbi:truncated transposase [Pseudooceanicola batsensis HTCC2597]|uniref:Truncated transposase n=1 Tax=Pseudooceanicola batsensis (strain ATCC BAA-863 / DSM 15984 / KCTC 12145 / HTCC2597) TaxID=252305 RepID=A3TY87_PSEBH|nr:transposase [Pseudooceanicola batsensis]EAQ03121.1 truncated transposase [Pseudooceanicola batsensis HTCC2597]
MTPGQPSNHQGYNAARIRDWAEARDALPVFPMHPNCKAREGVDRTHYPLRNLAERCFGRLTKNHRVATRYVKTAPSFLGFVDMACIRSWIRRFVNSSWRASDWRSSH